MVDVNGTVESAARSCSCDMASIRLGGGEPTRPSKPPKYELSSPYERRKAPSWKRGVAAISVGENSQVAPSAVRLYHRFCGAGKAHFCSHARPGKPPKFDDRSR